MRRLAVIACCFALCGCGRSLPPVVVHAPGNPPEQLSAWGVVLANGRYFRINDDVVPYDLNSPLFTDYALKMRTVWLPDGVVAEYNAEREFKFPVGTIISKTFHYPKAEGFGSGAFRVIRSEDEARLDRRGRLDLNDFVLVETRLLVRYETGWEAFPYVWNSEQTEAWLEVAGDVRNMQLVDANGVQNYVYVVPDANQCEGCHAPNHTDKAIRPIGPKAWQLNREYDYGGKTGNQLEYWMTRGLLTGFTSDAPTGVRWSDEEGASLDARARAYLDINCAHCHNSSGAADTSGLHLDLEAPVDRNFGICKSPTAVGRGSGDRLYDIHPGRPDESIMLYRMEHSDPAIAMPELGRSTVHAEGVQLISDWISSLQGEC